MRDIVGLKELRQNMGTYAARVKAGRSFVVVKHNKPLFKIIPLEGDEQWEEVIDFTKIRRGGVNIDDILRRL